MSNLLAEIPQPLVAEMLAALLYLVSAVVFFVVSSREHNELSVAFFAFLASTAAALGLLGLGQYAQADLLTLLGTFAVFTGSCFMLKLPFTALPKSRRNPAFYGGLVVSWLLLAWMMVTPLGRTLLPAVTLLYLIGLNGAISGLYMVWIGLRSHTPWVSVKAIGGGLGVTASSLAAYLANVPAASGTAAMLLQLGSPIILLAAIFWGRRWQRRAEQAAPPVVMPRP